MLTASTFSRTQKEGGVANQWLIFSERGIWKEITILPEHMDDPVRVLRHTAANWGYAVRSTETPGIFHLINHVLQSTQPPP
jgi:hypothetical protein